MACSYRRLRHISEASLTKEGILSRYKGEADDGRSDRAPLGEREWLRRDVKARGERERQGWGFTRAGFWDGRDGARADESGGGRLGS